jgi:hypothetical protein
VRGGGTGLAVFPYGRFLAHIRAAGASDLTWEYENTKTSGLAIRGRGVDLGDDRAVGRLT